MQERIKYVKKINQDKHEKLSKLKPSIEELTVQINEHESLDKNLREQLKEKEQDEIKARHEVEKSVIKVMNQIRQPQSLHEGFTTSLKEFKEKLDKAKLPEEASRQFFDEILEEKECICGRELNEETRQVIKQRAESYLSDHTTVFLNSLKEDIRNNLPSEPNEIAITLSNSIKQLKESIKVKQIAKTICRSFEQQLIEQGDDEFKSWNQALEEAKNEKQEIERFFENINRPQNHRDDPKYYTKTLCLSSLKKWLNDEEKKLAEIADTIKLYKRKQVLQEIIDKSLEKANLNLRSSILIACNEKLKRILSLDPIQISKIDRSLQLQGQKGASVGQTLSVSYTFLTTLLSRGQHQFPLVVDSPANSIDGTVRREIGKLIPQLCHQFVALTISTEREAFTDTFAQNSKNIKFLTVFRKTPGRDKLLQTLPQQGVTQTNNCFIVEGKDYFDDFDIKEYIEEN